MHSVVHVFVCYRSYISLNCLLTSYHNNFNNNNNSKHVQLHSRQLDKCLFLVGIVRSL